MSDLTIQRAAELLLSARNEKQLLEALPAEAFPADARESYLIQDIVTAQLGPIGGWKTAPSKDGVKFNWAPIPASGIFENAAEIGLATLPPCELELEVGFVVGADLPARDADYTRDEVVAALSEMVVCLELFSSRYKQRTARTPLEVLADAQNAFGAVVGTGLADWHALDLAKTALVFDYAGQRHTQAGGRVTEELIEAITDLANATGYLGGLRKGQVIITGARIGPIAATTAGIAHGEISPIGVVSLELL